MGIDKSEIIVEIIIATLNILTDFNISFGKGIANSYLAQLITARIDTVALQVEKYPKAIGEYNLESKGDAINVITCAINVPPATAKKLYIYFLLCTIFY